MKETERHILKAYVRLKLAIRPLKFKTFLIRTGLAYLVFSPKLFCFE